MTNKSLGKKRTSIDQPDTAEAPIASSGWLVVTTGTTWGSSTLDKPVITWDDPTNNSPTLDAPTVAWS